MNKKKVLVAAVVALCILNVVILAMSFFGPRHKRFDQKSKMEMVNIELGFDKDQKVAFSGLVDAHKYKIQKLRNEQSKVKVALYKTIGEEGQEAVRAEQQEKLNSINEEIETLNLKHFDDIRKLCNDDQVEKFIKFRSKLDKFFAPPIQSVRK